MTGLSAKNVDLSGFSGGSPGTGFSENYERQIDVVYNKSQSVSKYNAFQEAYAGRIESAREFGIDLESPVTPTNFFSLDESFEAFEKDFDEKTSHLDADQRALMGRERMLEKIRERSKRLQTEADFASENSTKMGAVGGFVGNVAGMMFDPFVIATLPLGAGASGFAGKTVLESFARGAVIEGAIAGAVEVPIQVGVQDFQKETLLDPNAGFKAGAINVAGATVGGGLLGGGMAAGIKAYQRKFGSESLDALYREVDGMDAKELARHIRENEGGFTEEQKQAGRELEQKAREEEANPYTAPKQGEAPETKTQSAVKEPAAPEIVQKKVKTVSDAEDDFLKETDPTKFEERLQELNAARLFADQQEKVNKAQFEFDKAKKEVDDLEPEPQEIPTQKAGPKEDSLLQTIGKMGGVNKQKIADEFGIDPRDMTGHNKENEQLFKDGAFKDEGGIGPDEMAELLAEEGFIRLDENGKYDLDELEEMIQAELRGDKQYKIGRDIADDEFEAAFLREVEDVSPELESARMRFAEKQGELNNALRELENAKKFTHEQNLAEANKAMNETRQPDIAENKNNPDPFRVKGERAREDAKELEDFSDPQEGKTAIDEQVREYDVLLEEARANPERADDPIAVGTETDVKKKTTPTVRTFSDIADEIEGDDDFMNGLVGCLR
jgi:hypothetical protein